MIIFIKEGCFYIAKDTDMSKEAFDKIAEGMKDIMSETLVGAPQLRQKAGKVQQGWRRGNGKMVWFDVPQVSEDAPDVE